MWSIGEAARIEKETYAAFRKSGVNIVALPSGEIDIFFNTLFKHSLENWLEICRRKGVADKASVIEKWWSERKQGRSKR